jgi:general secretion pathway protein H
MPCQSQLLPNAQQRQKDIAYRATRCVRNDAGFTLFELLIVLALMSLILSFSTVYWSNSLPGQQLDATARELSAALRKTRSLAMISGQKQTVEINLDERTCISNGKVLKTWEPDIRVVVTDAVAGEQERGRFSYDYWPAGGSPSGKVTLYRAARSVQLQLDPIRGSVIVR